MQVVVFEVGNGLFAFDISVVSEIIRSDIYQTSEVPLADKAFKGTAIIRGRVCNIISLHNILIRAGKDVTDFPVENTILLDTTNGYFGLEVGPVKNIETFAIEDVEELHALLKSDIVTKVLKSKDKLVSLLDMERIVSAINTGEPVKG